ncbi:hypothetical protein DFH94DRAFT_117027 [Russula ochroleuca]|uniref:Uncharacterized protein n=1 Tax=Russula ochroleuca TaxID=152965 RepID=A0A9P5K2G7_9AGAM|nr:hypothetical protein DFH94DRAFT_117027 [Russula ochroleuca]
MPTIASSAPPQRLPPGDADLQELYDQVLSAFAEESSPSNFSPTFPISRPNNVDPDSLYSPHGDEGVGSQVSSRPHAQSRASSSPRDNNRPLRSPTTFSTSPVLGKSPRPLPKLPAASPNSPSSYPTHMPEPAIVDPPPPASTGAKPYADQPRPPQYTAESHGNGSTAPPAERSPPPRGLPSDPRPAHKVPAGLRPGSSSSIDARSPSPAAGLTRDADSPQYSMPVPDTSSSSLGSYAQPWNLPPAGRKFSNGAQSPGSMLQKKTSFRPPGASAPRVPGHAIGLDSHDESSTFSPSSELYSPMTSLTFRPHRHLIHQSPKPRHDLVMPSNVTPRRIFLLQELMGLLVHSPIVSFSSFFQVSTGPTKLSFSACSIQQRAPVAINQHCLNCLEYVRERTGASLDGIDCGDHIHLANNIQRYQ